MAKRFFYVCAGIFLLSLSYHLGARSAAAQLASFRVVGHEQVVVGNEAWEFLLGGFGGVYGWEQAPAGDAPPVPPSHLLSWDGLTAITDTGEGWYKHPTSGWTSLGVVPMLATPAQTTTFGAIKAKYRR